MTKKVTLLFLFLTCSFGVINAQLVTDFEGASPVLENAFGMVTNVVANPNTSGLNTSANCLKVERPAGETRWFMIAAIDVDPDLAISSTDVKFLSMMVNYDLPMDSDPLDIGIRFDAPNQNVGIYGSGGAIQRGLNTYTDFGQWQEIVFEVKNNETNFSAGTIFKLDIHPDMGFIDSVGGFTVLTGIDGYIDTIRFTDSNTLSTEDFEQRSQEVSLFPNPSSSTFTIESLNSNPLDVTVNTVLGKKIVDGISQVTPNEFDISGLASGMYLVKIVDDKGSTVTKRLLKQ